jgi:DNA-binding MarR family transcriptional regulator
VAAAFHGSVSLFVRRSRQRKALDDELTPSERSALSRLDREGPATASSLARLEQISPQSMGATLAALEARGLVGRAADPTDGRRVTMSVTDKGAEELRSRRGARIEHLAGAMDAVLTRGEVRQLGAVAPLIERLAEAL